MIKINGVELEEFDIYKADNADKYEEAMTKVNDEVKKLQGLKTSIVIRKQCEIVFDFFNTIYGSGTDKKIFGNEVHLIKCMEALGMFVTYINEQKKSINGLLSKYSPDRLKRNKK